MMHTNRRTRTFIAVPIHPPRGLRKLLPKLDQLGTAVRPILVDQMHITLKFLGPTELDDIMPISHLLKKMRTLFPPIKLAFKGLGAFPNAERPNVIWAGISDPAPLAEMVQFLEQETELLGYPLERKGFHPHLTLARVNAKPPEELFEILRDRANAEWGEVTVDTIKFFQSELKTERAQYHEMQTIKLIHR
ncbi:RNA 2',3'-cyclic phosphodiesterase [uncultured Gimesia sp.]|uniref:RNA 2',3'-cyclic phosphodiesterase n=1 Tax=uncultured Gimesia sp. TaxID=1678688 RepID=UPI00261800AF|nr:RNA 2',3'-cyclic phosphodiesterase [uncultured Gimesia sp.]